MSLPSFQIAILTLSAGAGAIYALICSLRAGRHARSVRTWVVLNRPTAWQELPWVYKKVLVPEASLSVLRRHALAQDAEFLDLWRNVAVWQKRMLLSCMIVLASVLAAITGARLYGWHW